MASAIVVAERGAGLTTFVGLLYTAQVRLGIEASDEFRFHADRESVRAVEGVYGALGAGEFPVREIDWDGFPLSFVFGFRRRPLRGLGRSNGGRAAEFDTVNFRVGGLPVDDGADLDQYDARLTAETRDLLASPIVVILIDGTWLPSEPTDGSPPGIETYDRRISRTLDLLLKFRAADPDRHRRTLFPFVVLTKVDRLALEALRRFDAPGGPPTSWKDTDRLAFGERILRAYLPETARFLGHGKHDGVTVRPPRWFFSGVMTERRFGEERIARRERVPLGGWEPEYPFQEYRTLLREMGRIAHRQPGEPGEAGE